MTSSQTVTVSSAIAAYSTAGTQDTSTAGLAGTPVALTACPTTGGCVQNFNTVNGVTVTAADYAEQIEISVAQPASGGTATGFDMQIDILTNSGHVFGDAYISTATAQSTAQTVIVYLFVDLGVNTVTSPPTITSISVQFNSCLSTTSCP